jgi:glyoxylase-like metal-dependent hydrolase (beta-lactamase superfamily II)
MKVISLHGNRTKYTCNSYLVLGSWNRIDDVNTLIDVGVDGTIICEIENISTGVGKNPVERVILTHNHFDHSAGLAEIIRRYHPEVYAYSPFTGVDTILKDGQMLRIGDRDFEVIHSPGHSDDSVCLYCQQEKILFSGDTPINILTAEGTYNEAFVKSLEKIVRREIEMIFTGHNEPHCRNIRSMLHTTLTNVRNTKTSVLASQEER